MAEHDEATETPPPKKSKAKLFIVLGAAVVLLGGGGGAAWYFLKGGSHEGEKPEAKQVMPPQFLPLETFTVNLQDSDQYLQVDMTLQIPEAEMVETIKQHMPRVRSRLLALLASKQAEELFSAEGKAQLAKEIKAQIMEPLHGSAKPVVVDDVLFTSFVIQ